MAIDPGPFFDSIIGRRVSHVWRGAGSAIFLEFGELTPHTRLDGRAGNPIGDVSLMIEWSWRIERPRSIVGGSWSSERRWHGMLERLRGASVNSVDLFAPLPEIAVTLSNRLRVVSFMTAEGQPRWALICRRPPLGTLHVRRGNLHVESP